MMTALDFTSLLALIVPIAATNADIALNTIGLVRGYQQAKHISKRKSCLKCEMSWLDQVKQQ
jgi:hypothetical protein